MKGFSNDWKRLFSSFFASELPNHHIYGYMLCMNFLWVLLILYCLAVFATALLCAWLAEPLTRRIFAPMGAASDALCIGCGHVLFGTLVWTLYSWLGITCTALNLWLLLVLLVLLRLFWKNTCASSVRVPIRWKTHTLFILFYAGWLLFRSFAPDISHTEQPMDLLMLQNVLQSPHDPVQDLWLAGTSCGYYWFGYWLLMLPLKLWGIPAATGYNIMQAFWFAFTLSTSCAVGHALGQQLNLRKPLYAGLLACMALCISNPRGLLDALWSGTPVWWWTASRAISDGGSELITEFPVFSFLLGDNHPHLLAIPLVLLLIALIWCLLMPYSEESKSNDTMRIGMAALLIGLLIMTNTWNAPAALMLNGLCLLVRNGSFRSKAKALGWLSLFLCGTLLLLLPYFLRAKSQFAGLQWFPSDHTGVVDYLTVFGFFLPVLLLPFMPLLPGNKTDHFNCGIPLQSAVRGDRTSLHCGSGGGLHPGSVCQSYEYGV